MPALISIAAAPVAPHGTACRHGSSGIGVPVGDSFPFGGVCLFSDQMMESKPPAGPPGVPSCGLQPPLFPPPVPPEGVLCGALRLSQVSPWTGKAPLALHGNALREFAPLGIRLRRALRSCAPGVWLVFARSPSAGSLRPERLRARNTGDGCRLPVLPPSTASVLRETASCRGLTARARFRHAACNVEGRRPAGSSAAPPDCKGLPRPPVPSQSAGFSPQGLPHLPW